MLAKYRLPSKFHPYIPNWVGIGLAFTIPSPACLAFAMVCGAITAALVRKLKPATWEKFGYPVAAGFTAGEACSGLLLAGLVIAGVDGGTLGTKIGCAFGDC